MSGKTPTRGVTPGLPTNNGSFKAAERAESGVSLATLPDPRRTETLTVTAANGVPFTIAVVREGETYGRSGALVAERTLVEFRDARYPDLDLEGKGRGQFVSRYDIGTLRGEGKWGSEAAKAGYPGGIDLHGGAPDWKVDGATMAKVSAWLDEQVPRETADPKQALIEETKANLDALRHRIESSATFGSFATSGTGKKVGATHVSLEDIPLRDEDGISRPRLSGGYFTVIPSRGSDGVLRPAEIHSWGTGVSSTNDIAYASYSDALDGTARRVADLEPTWLDEAYAEMERDQRDAYEAEQHRQMIEQEQRHLAEGGLAEERGW